MSTPLAPRVAVSPGLWPTIRRRREFALADSTSPGVQSAPLHPMLGGNDNLEPLNPPMGATPHDRAAIPRELAGARSPQGCSRRTRRMQRNGDVARHPDPDYPERLEYLVNQVMDSAHEILDLAHDLKHARRARKTEKTSA